MLFRSEDILKLPGGENGKAYQALSEMTSLIERQQHIIRETHRYQQSPDDDAKLREQDRRKLSEGEGDLSDSVRHLYAKMTTEMENKPIGEALDNLAKAAKSLNSASDFLLDDKIKEGQNEERLALTDLIAARKMFQKALSDHPSDFDEKSKPDEPEPVAEASKQLRDISEFRNEAKAAQDFIQKAVERQKQLAENADTVSRAEQQKRAQEETKLQKSLDDFEQQHPQMFRGVTNQSAAADQSLKRAAESLQKRSRNVKTATDNATTDLEKLQAAMKSQATGRQLTDAYRLKQMLDQQIQSLDQLQAGTNKSSGTNLQNTASQSRETLNQLKQIAENKPAGNMFGPELLDSLSGTNKSKLDSQLNKLAQAQGRDAQKQAAGEAKQGLQKVSDAFQASEPSAMQAAQKQDSLKSSQDENFERGMEQLESLKRKLESGRPLSSSQEARERQEAFYNLNKGLLDYQGNDQTAKQLLALLEEDLKDPGKPMDVAMLKKLMDQLRNFSVEVADKQDKKENPEMTNVDPSRLPPAYRGRIEKYYQKLSDQKQ